MCERARSASTVWKAVYDVSRSGAGMKSAFLLPKSLNFLLPLHLVSEKTSRITISPDLDPHEADSRKELSPKPFSYFKLTEG